MTVAEITSEMIAYSNGNLHDINHFLNVFSLAETIGMQEHLSPTQQMTLEIAALLHDIACPLCRSKYGNTNGKYQEAEGESLARAFLQGKGLPPEVSERVVFLVAHHHTYTNVNGPDYRILLEADYLVNACESAYSAENIQNASCEIFKTETGSRLLRCMYPSAFSASSVCRKGKEELK